MTFDFNRIHHFRFDDLCIVLDVNSGSVHVVDDDTMFLLDLLEAGTAWEEALAQVAQRTDEETARDIGDAINELIDAGMLFSSADFSDYTPHTEPIVKAICLHMAHDCNLRCGYCFADSGAYGGGRSLMSAEVGKAAMDFLMKASKHRTHVEVDFFGGEPLLNFEVCKEVAAYGRKVAAEHGKVLKLTLTTNGVLLNDDVIRWMDDNKIDAVLSLDGRPEVHNRMRRFVGGGPSYEPVVKNFLRFAEGRNPETDWYYLRGTYTHYNPDFAQDVIHMADDLGFTELSMEPVVAPESAPYMLTEDDKPILLENYDTLTRHYLKRRQEGRGYDFYHFNVDFDGGPCLPKRLAGCGSGHDYLAVSPEGDLYPCHQFVGEEDYKMGTVFTGIVKPEIAARFQEATVLTKPTCMNCWARFNCSGGCHANNIRYGGGLNEPYSYGCDLQRKRIECALYLECKRLLDAEEAAETQSGEAERAPADALR